MIIFHTDLDNTLIYSYKHNIGEKKRCVEIYQGREISFVTQETYRLLQMLSERKGQVLIVPTTTRTIEQYQRIDLGVGTFPY
ncbi:MAG: HAD family hydrolase, partial [Lachnospiraceae bacterium]|nr:HAD family hydrolase [Lachnospiraceae bacterium]